jgi:hypothetical protein
VPKGEFVRVPSSSEIGVPIDPRIVLIPSVLSSLCLAKHINSQATLTTPSPGEIVRSCFHQMTLSTQMGHKFSELSLVVRKLSIAML